MLLLSLAVACSDYSVIKEPGSETSGSDGASGDTADTEADTSMWDGATLQVEEPISGAFLPYEESSPFKATVYDVDGNATDFSDIAWVSDADGAWTPNGAAFDDDSLDVGTHALTATAVLPNGNRLQYTIGGVLVQSAYTGVYVGTLQVDVAIDYNGTAYEVGCAGALTLIVDQYGEAVTGDAGCLISLLGYELDTAYVFDMENDDGDVSGDAAVDLQIYEYGMETEANLTEDGEIEGDFADSIAGYLDVAGAYSAERVSRDVSAYF